MNWPCQPRLSKVMKNLSFFCQFFDFSYTCCPHSFLEPTFSYSLQIFSSMKVFIKMACSMLTNAKIMENLSFLPIFSIFLTLAVPTAFWNPFFRIPCKFLRRYRSLSLNFLHKNSLFHANLCKNHGKSVNFADFFNFSHTCCFHSILGPIFSDSLRFFTWI